MTTTVHIGHISAEPLTVATAIGARLVAEAIWSGQRCNWIGAQPVDRRNLAVSASYQALGPSLYGGTSGVALFLAELYLATGREELRTTATGALRHAISRRDDIDPSARLGFYVGWAGLAAAALRIGRRLDCAEFVDAGTALLADVSRLVAAADADQQFDLVSGMAGALPALAFGHRISGEARLLAASIEAGDWLRARARTSRTGWSWATPGLRNQRDLTGLSHGAAGVAVGLVEAYRLTGEERFAAGARRAMDYENRWLDRDLGNWPDFRENPADPTSRTYVNLWCHGAPGIALSRLYAYEHLGGERWLADARLALDTTARTARQLADGGATDFSLCHGLAGIVDALLEATPILDPGVADLPFLAADHGVQRYARPGVPWPCGTHTAETPSLLLGLAGIGYFYLRLAAPLPSVLLPVRWDG